MPDLLIGHDVGTGGSKAVLADAEGNIHARSYEPYEVSYPKPHWAEQDPVDWWRAVSAGTRQLMADSGADPADVKGMGFSGQMLTFVPVDASGKPLRPAITWLDSRADEQAARRTPRLLAYRGRPALGQGHGLQDRLAQRERARHFRRDRRVPRRRRLPGPPRDRRVLHG
jgi:xylulokinase